MRDLLTTLDTIRERIKDHRTNLAKNEAMTRYVLIDPLLRSLDWDVSNPKDVVPEEGSGAGGKTDYTMGRNSMVVEAKKFGEVLDRHTDKLVDYIRTRDVRYGVLTNGSQWRMYDSKETTRTPVVEFDVNDANGIIIPKAARLHRSVVYHNVPRPTLKPEPKPERESNIPLSDVVPEVGKRHPMVLVCPDEERALSSWADLLAGVAEWLVVRGHLTKSHCPVKSGPANSILSTHPVHQNGKRFRTERKVGKLFVDVHVSQNDSIGYALKLIDVAGLKKSDFRVRFVV